MTEQFDMKYICRKSSNVFKKSMNFTIFMLKLNLQESKSNLRNKFADKTIEAIANPEEEDNDEMYQKWDKMTQEEKVIYENSNVCMIYINTIQKKNNIQCVPIKLSDQ